MKGRIFLLFAVSFLAALMAGAPCLFAKAERKDKGYNKAYLNVDEKTKEVKFKDDVKLKVEQVLQGALQAVKAADQSSAEQDAIEDAILNKYDSATEYAYDGVKDYKGDEDDPDLESPNMKSKDFEIFVANLDATRDQNWGWYWAQQNRDKRGVIEGKKWTVHKIIKKLAWKHYRLALGFHAKADYANAKKQLLIALWFWPKFVEAHTQLGIENIALKLLDEAEKNLKRAIKIDPEFGKAYYILSILYMIKTPPQVFDSVEAVQYAKDLGYTGEQDYFDFVMQVANLPNQ